MKTIKALGQVMLFVTAMVWSPLLFAQNLFHVSGKVVLHEQGKHRRLKDESQVAVWLVPVDGDPVAKASYRAPQFQMRQQDKRFEPHLLVIPVGSTVKFPNRDPWFHNVFSLYRGKRFDLGLYQAGSQKSVQFDRLGPSYIFCNIHPEMSAVILAVDSHFIGVSDSSGKVSIADVPAGRYRVHFWYEFAAEPEELESREIAVGQEDVSFGTTTVTVKSRRDPKHTNKYGGQYDPQTLNPSY